MPMPGARTAPADVLAFAGAAWRVETNSPAIREAAQETFGPAEAGFGTGFRFRLLVDERLAAPASAMAPYFRGRDHLVFAGYGGGAMVFDLLGRRAVGVFSEALASDRQYWRRVILPVAAGVVSPSVGVVPLHCATLVRNGRGLHVSGLSGAGKSTLAVALARRGHALLSDDWTYFARGTSGLTAYGLPVPIKLMPDTRRFFAELAELNPTVALNGELAFEVDPVETFGVARARKCAPERIIFLERRAGPARWLRLTPAQVENQFRPALERIPECLAGARRAQHEIIAALAQCEAWSLACGGDPGEIADEILRATEGNCQPPWSYAPAEIAGHFEIPDLMRRFVPAPLSTHFAFGATCVRLETDVPAVLAQAKALRRRSRCDRAEVVCSVLEDDVSGALTTTEARDDGLSYRLVAEGACVLRDRNMGRVVAFVSDAYAKSRDLLPELLSFC